MARHVLGILISTVASKSIFSTRGRVIDVFRSSLTIVTAKALICTQNWILSTPTDIQFKEMSVKGLEELREKLEHIEIDELKGKNEAGKSGGSTGRGRPREEKQGDAGQSRLGHFS